jgi:putative oxidoreductase
MLASVVSMRLPASSPLEIDRSTAAAQRTALDYGLWLLRFGAGGTLLAVHGWGRLLKAFGMVVQGHPWPFVAVVQRMGLPAPTFLAVASALAESAGAVLLICGLWTRWAAAVIAINMAVALWLKVSQGGSEAELPGVYLVIMIAIGLTGAGAFSLDAARRRLTG